MAGITCMRRRKPNNKLDPEVAAELLQITRFSKTQLKQWYKIYEKHAQGENLTQESFQNIYGKYFSSGDASKFATHVFRQFDIDGDKTIDFHEFMVSINVTSHGTFDEKLAWLFSLYDVDQNGHISREEMKDIVTSVLEMVGTLESRNPEGIVERIFAEMDEDKNEEISLEEFLDVGKRATHLVELLQTGSTENSRARKSGNNLKSKKY